MSVFGDRSGTRSAGTSADEAVADPSAGWSEPEAPPRDWKKLTLVIGLGALSWVATYVGMLELIEANMGDLPIVHKAIIGFSVAMLMIMIIWLLDQLFAPIPTFTKLVYAIGYVFLTLISVGFGFGFYWKVLESRSESSRSAESAVTQVQSSLHAASTRLDQLSTTLVQLTQVSTAQAEVERARGTSCPNSKPGDGPRRKLRDDDAARFTFASDFVKTRADTVKGELSALDADLVKIASNDASLVDAKSGTRNEFMKALSRKLDLTVTGFNAFRTDPQLRQIRTDLAERAEKTTFADSKGGSFACPDPQLQTALRGVVRAIDQLPDLEKPKIAAVEGSEATIEAFRRLTATMFGVMSFKMPPSADELRDLQKKAVQSVEAAPAGQRAPSVEAVGLSKRDYIPLAIAAFVDLCLLLVSMGRPANRLTSLVSKMREAERGPVIQILSRFNEIHRDPVIRQNFEVFRHVVFDFNGAYYVAVPLDAPYRFKRTHDSHGVGTAQVEALQQEAHLLANLFASFEKEKLFTRVYTPLLSTRAIQKKLWRQGSKFAGCEAFRVYRFKDGAWSELILGAVMGAARRVEAEKARRRGEEIVSAGLAGAPRTSGGQDPRAAAVRPPHMPAEGAHRPHPAGPHAAPPMGYRRPAQVPPRQAASFDANAATGHAAPRAATADETAKWGPYAPYATAPQTASRAASRAFDGGAQRGAPSVGHGHANSNTAPASAPGSAAAAASLPPNVTALPHVTVRAQGALPPVGLPTPPFAVAVAVDPAPATAVARPLESPPPRIERSAAADADRIVLSRTETITLPATAAALPAALMRAGFAGGAGSVAATAVTERIPDALPTIALPSPARSPATEPARRDAPAAVVEIVSAEDIATLRRFAPDAAE